MAVFFRDVTLAKHAEELARQQAAFERQLIEIVSHDRRNPLNVIGMAATRLRREDDLSPKAAQNVVRVQNANERAVRLIRETVETFMRNVRSEALLFFRSGVLPTQV